MILQRTRSRFGPTQAWWQIVRGPGGAAFETSFRERHLFAAFTFD
jgi:hypothetical protein